MSVQRSETSIIIIDGRKRSRCDTSAHPSRALRACVFCRPPDSRSISGFSCPCPIAAALVAMNSRRVIIRVTKENWCLRLSCGQRWRRCSISHYTFRFVGAAPLANHNYEQVIIRERLPTPASGQEKPFIEHESAWLATMYTGTETFPLHTSYRQLSKPLEMGKTGKHRSSGVKLGTSMIPVSGFV